MSTSIDQKKDDASPPPTSTKRPIPPPVTTEMPIQAPSGKDPTVPPTPTIKSASPKSARPALPSLITPKTATFPSEYHKPSPHPGRLGGMIKEEEDLKTPITPPTAYTDFLKAISPAVSTPSTGRSPIFERMSTGKSTPVTQPSSAASCNCGNQMHGETLKASASAPMIPPSPYMRPPSSARLPKSARTPTSLRRLRIPQSPIWSPATDSPLSSAMRSPYSPADWGIEGKARYFISPTSGTHKPVSVRQVVTRTVTYTRTPLDPAPKGKKRRLD